MTALAGRRRRATVVAAVTTVLVLVLGAALTVLGAVTLYNSTEGAARASGPEELAFPDTPTGALVALDDEGHLASIAVLVVQPAGRGGSIVAVPVDADASGGVGEERLPLAETVALQGTDALARELEVTLRLRLDQIEVVDADRLDDLLAPLGELEVDLPADVVDGAGDVVAEAGRSSVDAGTAARILTARDPEVPASEQYGAAAAVWSAVAAGAGEGIGVDGGPPTTPEADDRVDDADELLARLLAGRIGYRSLRWSQPDPADNPRDVDVVVLDPSELVLVFGQIAPGAVAAPSAGLTMRLVSAFTDEQLAASGMTNTEVAYGAISSLLFVGGNVRSVSTTGDPPGGPTRIEVADETLAVGTETVEVLFGEVDVEVAERPIVGIDATITLGTDYLELLRSGAPAPSTTVPPTTSEAPDD